MMKAYKHYKGGIYYLLLDNALHTESDEKMVVYFDSHGNCFVRPFIMFYGHVWKGDDRVRRFERIRDCDKDGYGEGINQVTIKRGAL